MNTYTVSDITELRQGMENYLRQPDSGLPVKLAHKDDTLSFLAGFMAPWAIAQTRDDSFLLPNAERDRNEAGIINEIALEGQHRGRPSEFLRVSVLLPAIERDDSKTALIHCHKAYWKTGPYADFFRRVYGLRGYIQGIDQPNMLGALLYYNRLELAAGTAFMLPGLVANRTDYWRERFIAAGADPDETPVFLEGLQNYWDATLPR